MRKALRDTENCILHSVCPKVSIIVVDHNGKERLETYL